MGVERAKNAIYSQQHLIVSLPLNNYQLLCSCIQRVHLSSDITYSLDFLWPNSIAHRDVNHIDRHFFRDFIMIRIIIRIELDQILFIFRFPVPVGDNMNIKLNGYITSHHITHVTCE